LPPNVLATHEAPVVNHANGEIDFSYQGATDNTIEESAAITHPGGRQFVLTPEEEENWENCDSSV
jgi:hypothetical protein